MLGQLARGHVGTAGVMLGQLGSCWDSWEGHVGTAGRVMLGQLGQALVTTFYRLTQVLV